MCKLEFLPLITVYPGLWCVTYDLPPSLDSQRLEAIGPDEDVAFSKCLWHLFVSYLKRYTHFETTLAKSAENTEEF